MRPGGALVLVGCVTPGTDLNITGEAVVRRCASLLGVHNYNQADLSTAVQFLQNTPYQVADPLNWSYGAVFQAALAALVSPPVPLHQFQQALQLARSGRYQRVLLDCSQHTPDPCQN